MDLMHLERVDTKLNMTNMFTKSLPRLCFMDMWIISWAMFHLNTPQYTLILWEHTLMRILTEKNMYLHHIRRQSWLQLGGYAHQCTMLM